MLKVKTEISKLEFLSILVWIFFFIFKVSGQNCSSTAENITAILGEFQTLFSPGFNGTHGNYAENLSCVWIIDAGADDLKLMLTVRYKTQCTGDHISLFDGMLDDPGTALMNKECGNTMASYAFRPTTQRYARVEFITDSSLVDNGFIIEYMAAKNYAGTGCSTALQTLTSSATFQFLSTPGFPFKYPSDNKCRWLIQADPGYVVEVDILFSDFEADPPACEYDKYEIYDGIYICENNALAKVCEDYPKQVNNSFVSSGAALTLTMSSDATAQQHGFLLRYRSREVTLTTTTETTSTTITEEESTSQQMLSSTIDTLCHNGESTDNSATKYSSTAIVISLEIQYIILIGFGELVLLSLVAIVTAKIVACKMKGPTGSTPSTVEPFKRPIASNVVNESKTIPERKRISNGTYSNTRRASNVISAW